MRKKFSTYSQTSFADETDTICTPTLVFWSLSEKLIFYNENDNFMLKIPFRCPKKSTKSQFFIFMKTLCEIWTRHQHLLQEPISQVLTTRQPKISINIDFSTFSLSLTHVCHQKMSIFEKLQKVTRPRFPASVWAEDTIP